MNCNDCPYLVEHVHCGLYDVELDINQNGETVKFQDCNLSEQVKRDLPFIEIPAVNLLFNLLESPPYVNHEGIRRREELKQILKSISYDYRKAKT